MSKEKPKDDDDPVEARRGIKEATHCYEQNEKNKKEKYPSRGNRGDRRRVSSGGERRGTRSDRDVRSDLVGESNLAK